MPQLPRQQKSSSKVTQIVTILSDSPWIRSDQWTGISCRSMVPRIRRHGVWGMEKAWGMEEGSTNFCGSAWSRQGCWAAGAQCWERGKGLGQATNPCDSPWTKQGCRAVGGQAFPAGAWCPGWAGRSCWRRGTRGTALPPGRSSTPGRFWRSPPPPPQRSGSGSAGPVGKVQHIHCSHHSGQAIVKICPGNLPSYYCMHYYWL